MGLSLAATVLFDSLYLEPGLVTAYELIEQLDVKDRLYLIYLSRGAEEEQEDLALIQTLCEEFRAKVSIHAITLNNSLPAFSSCHFNNAILYKALLPLAINSEPYLVNFDAGILLGGKFGAFWKQLKHDLVHRDDGRWIIGAHCHNPEDMLPSALGGVPHNAYYPAGNLLVFHTRRYLESAWQKKFLDNYSQFTRYLNYAEQELMCLCSAEGEIMALPGMKQRITPFLGLEVLRHKTQPLELSVLQDCLFFKFVGSLKPWKYWVLDPNKFIYLKRRSLLEAKFPLNGVPAIERHRTSCNRDEWASEFLRAYDSYLTEQQ
jgi:hypothetical protein